MKYNTKNKTENLYSSTTNLFFRKGKKRKKNFVIFFFFFDKKQMTRDTLIIIIRLYEIIIEVTHDSGASQAKLGAAKGRCRGPSRVGEEDKPGWDPSAAAPSPTCLHSILVFVIY